MTTTRHKPKKQMTVKARAELEQKFLGSVIAMADEGDVRGTAAGYGISWRQFRDKRHRALWRALETLNLRSIDERMDVLEKEMYADAPKLNPITDGPEDDLVRGQPGSAAARQFKEKLIEGSGGLSWLERELGAAGALADVGGKVYLRNIANSFGDTLLTSDYAHRLFGINCRAPETKKESDDPFAGLSEEEVLYLESLRNSASAEDRKKFLEALDAKRAEKEKAGKDRRPE